MLVIILILVIVNCLDVAVVNGNVRKVSRQLKRMEKQMADQYDALIAALNEATNKIAARFQAELDEIAKLKAVGNPPTDDQMKSLQAQVDRLTAMGTDPADPTGTGAVSSTEATAPASAPTT